MTSMIDGAIAATGKAPDVFAAQPRDGLRIGEDTLSAVGDYNPPFALRGKVENVKTETK